MDRGGERANRHAPADAQAKILEGQEQAREAPRDPSARARNRRPSILIDRGWSRRWSRCWTGTVRQCVSEPPPASVFRLDRANAYCREEALENVAEAQRRETLARCAAGGGIKTIVESGTTARRRTGPSREGDGGSGKPARRGEERLPVSSPSGGPSSCARDPLAVAARRAQERN